MFDIMSSKFNTFFLKYTDLFTVLNLPNVNVAVCVFIGVLCFIVVVIICYKVKTKNPESRLDSPCR